MGGAKCSISVISKKIKIKKGEIKMSKKTINLKLLTAFICFIMIFALAIIPLTTLMANADTKINKVLFVVEEETAAKELKENITNFNCSEEYYDIDILDNIDNKRLVSYAAIALPSNIQTDYDININSTRCYIYGELTISDYKSLTGLNEFALDIDIESIGENKSSTIKQYFDKEYEETQVFNIIGFGTSALLCSLGDDIDTKYMNCVYLYNILDDCVKFLAPKTRSTIIESKFEFTTAMFGGVKGGGVAHMDYTLYRNYDEESTVYDYFAIKTRTWLTSEDGKKTEINTKYVLPNKSDNLLETGPASVNNAGSLSVSVGFGTSGVSGSIGFSVDLSNVSPNIKRTEDYTNDTVEWAMTQRTWFPKYLNGVSLECAATWASLASNHVAAIDVYFGGRINIGPNYQYPVKSESKQVPIRFSY